LLLSKLGLAKILMTAIFLLPKLGFAKILVTAREFPWTPRKEVFWTGWGYQQFGYG
jgi:hypothetical protein